ncbi:MAG: class I SAM-dependent methyltransferase [Patescibacteria group bacterium]
MNTAPLSTPQLFWEQRAQEGKIYGDEPSFGSRQALHYLKKGDEVLEVGGAYGRNSIYFTQHGMRVTNIDLSKTWIRMADKNKDSLPLINKCQDIRTAKFKKTFDVIFSNFVLHFFNDTEVLFVMKKLYKALKVGGLLINSWLSSNDIYAHTRYKNGLYIHCYTKEELDRLHAEHDFEIINMFETIELERINTNDRKTFLWFTVAKKVH